MRFFTHAIVIATLGIALVSCTRSQNFQSADLFEEFPEPVTLALDREYSLYLGSPAGYLVADSLLFTLEIGQDRFIRCINLNTEQETGFFLNKGRGPGEFINALSLRRYSKDSIQVYGNHPPAIIQFSINDVKNGIEISNYRQLPILGDFKIYPYALRVDEKKVLFHGTLASQEDEKRFCLYDTGTGEYETFGNYNPAFFQDMDLKSTSKNLINQPVIQFHPTLDRFVAVTPNFKSIEIYDLNTKEIVASRYYELPKAEIQTVDGFTVVFSSEEQKGFSEVHCTEQAIYCFYTDRNEKELNKPLYIFVYDWQLRPKVCYTVQACHASGFVTADDRYIYASKIDPETEEFVFCRYDI